MHIGIDVSSLAFGRGVSVYTANLVRALAESKNTDVSVYGSSLRQRAKIISLVSQLGPLKSTVIDHYPPTLLNYLWRWNLNPIERKLPKIEVFHSWDWLQPPDKHLPIVSTIHDLAILKYPEMAHPRVLAAHQRAWDILKQRKSHIIAVSHATKKDIVELLQIPANRVHVIYEALPVEKVQISEKISDSRYEKIKMAFNLDKPFILFVGTREPRKNLQRLIKAWRPLKKDYDLVIVGAKGWDETSANPPKWMQDVRFVGRVDDQELAVLYAEAELLAYPSLDEGFGLPILEAFHHGTPVVTSDRSAMIEVAGNAAELVDPESEESIRLGLETILNESDAQAEARIKKMILRLHVFDWRTVARETRAVYKQAIEEFKS